MINGLERITEVHMGDIVRLEGSRGNAVGYVHEITPTEIALSLRDPLDPAKWVTHGAILSPQPAYFKLDSFDRYEVLARGREKRE